MHEPVRHISNTPRTDAYVFRIMIGPPDGCDMVPASVSRTLERELAQALHGWTLAEKELIGRTEELENENAKLQAAINAFAEQYREVKAWHDAPLIKALFDLSNAK